MGTTFYLGTHRPLWLTTSQVPLFVSASTLAKYKTTGDRWPTRAASTFGSGSWALDSGAFTALAATTKHRDDHPWHLDPDSYGGMVYRFIDEIGPPPQFAAIQDWPCEPSVREATGFSVQTHQELTIDAYLWMVENFPHVNWAPVIQGWTVAEYIRHLGMYEAAGVDLSEVNTVGLGSVCRRGPVGPIVTIVETVQSYARQRYGRQLNLHGFGLKIEALRRVGHLLKSADSMAWSARARLENIRLAGCAHRGPCNNCQRYALRWREQVLAAIAAPRQRQDALFELSAA